MAETDQAERFDCPLDGVDTLLAGPNDENRGSNPPPKRYEAGAT